MANKNSGLAWAITIFSFCGIVYLLALTYSKEAQAYEGLSEPVPEFKFYLQEC